MSVRRMKAAGFEAMPRQATTKKMPLKATSPKKSVAKKAARSAPASRAALLLHELRPSVDALHDRVEKLRLRFA